MNKIYSLLAALLCVSSTAFGQIVITDGDLTGGNTYNWTADNEYVLDGFVFLEAGGVLNIEAGTVIYGKEIPSTSDNTSALVITKDAKIFANGTAAAPIVFTTEYDDPSDNTELDETDNGLWGGLIILGNARLAFSADSANIEGIPTTETRGFYGGFDDADNSGSLTYVSIRHGGAALSPGNEINGLTLGGVGSGTVMENIEVYANFDDGIEFFGGTVGCKWCIAAFCGDDAFDYDYGWRGKGQFWFVIQREDQGDNGGEHDGANPDAATPFSNPTIYNATYIGSGIGATAGNATALLFRDAAGGTYANSIFTDYTNFAIEVEDLPDLVGVDSRQRMEDGDLVLKNNLWYNFGSGSELNAGANGIIRATDGGGDATAAFLITHLTNNANAIQDPMLTSISRTNDGLLDPRPDASGPAFSDVADEPAGDAFFDDVNYKGAFGSDLWTNGWTALSSYGAVTAIETIDNAVTGLSAYPNPTSGQATLAYTLEDTEMVSIYLKDITGRIVQTVADQDRQLAGEQLVLLDATGLNAGLYLVEIQLPNSTTVLKLNLVK